MFGLACIWAAVFNLGVVFYIAFVNSNFETHGISMLAKSLLVTGIGLIGVVANDIAQVILPPIEDGDI